MGRKWARYKTRDEAWADMSTIIEKLDAVRRNGTWGNQPRRVEGGNGRSSFNFRYHIDKDGYVQARTSMVHYLKRLRGILSDLGYGLSNVNVTAGSYSLEMTLHIFALPPCEKCKGDNVTGEREFTHLKNHYTYKCNDCGIEWVVTE